MDFKAYSEFVLPPERGTGIKREKSRRKKAGSGGAMPKPREFRYEEEEELVLLDDDRSLVGNIETGSVAPRAAEALPNGPTTASETPPVPPADPAAREPSTSPEKDATRATPSVPSAPAADKPAKSADVQDYIISYYGQFVGHFRSSKRITHRTAFIKAAQRLQAMVEDVDLDALELYKPVPVKFERPDAVELADEFRWFTAEQAH